MVSPHIRCAVIGTESALAAIDESAFETRTPREVIYVHAADASRLPCEIDAALIAGIPADLSRVLNEVAAIRRERANCAVLVTGEGFSAEHLTSIFSAGAHDFIGCPISSDELHARLRRAVGSTHVDAVHDVRHLSSRLPDFVGRSAAFTKQVAKLPMIAGCDAGVLILGETGTGKEVFARAIHYLSARASRPCVAVNCASIPAELMESELFGHARGAYTNAHGERAGLVREAEGGTLFLDEIDCVPYGAQAKLLRFVQEKEYRPIGANGVHRADVRIVAASNSDLDALVQRGTFRRDLYFRLNVLSVSLPCLRDRRDDIPDLALHFISRFARQFGRPVSGATPAALGALCSYAWPGNIRELAHVIERAVLMAPGPLLGAADVDLGSAQSWSDESFRAAKARVVDEFERGYIERMLATHGGNVTHAAQAAKKNRRAFFELIRKHKIAADRFRSPS